MWQTEFLITPAKPLAVRLTYYSMNAFHSFPLSDTRIFPANSLRDFD